MVDYISEKAEAGGRLDGTEPHGRMGVPEIVAFCTARGVAPGPVLGEIKKTRPRLWSSLVPEGSVAVDVLSTPLDVVDNLPTTVDGLVQDAKRRGRPNTNPNSIAAVARDLNTTQRPLYHVAVLLREAGIDDKSISQYIYFVQKYWDGDKHLTDLGNARRLVALYGDDLRYCPALGWLVWGGQRWARDDVGLMAQYAKEVTASWHFDADVIKGAVAFAQGDEEWKWLTSRARAIRGHAKASESASRLKAMLEVASTEPTIPVQVGDLDGDPWLLNVNNGTIDLRTGHLFPHRRGNLITRLAPVNHDADARLDLWDGFLNEATAGDEDLERFLQRAAGYTLTGTPTEEVLFLAHGPGAAGKSTFLEALKATLGDYAASAEFETFTKRKGDGGVRNDIAKLASSRMVISIEVDRGKELAEGLVKSITGGDTVTARYLYKEYFEFRPSFTLWLAANDAPEIDEADDAMWRRVRLVPFTNAVPPERRDPTLKPKLMTPSLAGTAILAWLVKGCLAWQEEGLGVPKCVIEATAAYRQSMDVITSFIDECCVRGPNESLQTGELYPTYKAWAERNGEPVLNHKALAAKLRKQGFKPEKVRGARGWRGLGLRCLTVPCWSDPSLPSYVRALPSG